MLPLDTIISKNKRVPWRIIESEAVLVKVDSGEVVHLNEVAAEIWRIIDGKRKISGILAHICRSFDVKEQEAEKDTLDFLESLLDKDLVTVKEK